MRKRTYQRERTGKRNQGNQSAPEYGEETKAAKIFRKKRGRDSTGIQDGRPKGEQETGGKKPFNLGRSNWNDDIQGSGRPHIPSARKTP